MTRYKTLTPKFRQEIFDSIDREVEELNTCHENAFVYQQRIALAALRNLIKALPDGYPLPLANDRYMHEGA